ncbi:MAG: putative xanthine dehydrogenase FAD-binding subunit [Actinomycetia bacterium]|nr:putative xanthine dehydrogenase FAD-binding subunit [Actinomycetes bacterium]
MAVLLPTTIDETLAALAATPAALVLAGGTDVMVDVNEGRRRPEHVVCLRRVETLRARSVENGTLVLGAATTYTELLEPEIAAVAPAITDAARTVGSPQIRNAGTIGGNLATASPAGDTLPVLLALGASVEIDGPAGRRRIALQDFLVGPKRSALEPGDLMIAVRIPIRRGPQEYLKVGTRNAMVIAVASLALVVDLDARTVGIGLGSVGPTAFLAAAAAEWLTPRLVWADDRVSLPQAADAATFAGLVAAAAQPIDDHRSTARYRTHAIEVMASRALRRAVQFGAPHRAAT